MSNPNDAKPAPGSPSGDWQNQWEQLILTVLIAVTVAVDGFVAHGFAWLAFLFALVIVALAMYRGEHLSPKLVAAVIVMFGVMLIPKSAKSSEEPPPTPKPPEQPSEEAKPEDRSMPDKTDLASKEDRARRALVTSHFKTLFEERFKSPLPNDGPSTPVGRVNDAMTHALGQLLDTGPLPNWTEIEQAVTECASEVELTSDDMSGLSAAARNVLFTRKHMPNNTARMRVQSWVIPGQVQIEGKVPNRERPSTKGPPKHAQVKYIDAWLAANPERTAG